jgi:D-glycero-D-manno-heptose 1,7-bisphosphate phosphatase
MAFNRFSPSDENTRNEVGISEMKHRGIFLDRDGVINKVIIRDGQVYSPVSKEEFEFVDGVANAVKVLKSSGFRVIVVTNQPDIARNKMSKTDLAQMTERVIKETGVDDVVVCPHDDNDRCQCRKPKPGMLVNSAKKWNIDLPKSFVIGDSWKDIEAGKKAGCACVLINAKYNKDVACHLRVKSLSDAVELILKIKVQNDLG